MDFETLLRQYADELRKSFTMPLPGQGGNPEDQLKPAVKALLERSFPSVVVNTEVSTALGRPDLGVYNNRVLVGFIELKAPGKGAQPKRFKGHDRIQWKRFKNLPNLVYTDGEEWTLIRNGEVIRQVLLGDDLVTKGAKAVFAKAATALNGLLQDFLLWEPQAPRKPADLATLLAPVTSFIRAEVEEAATKEGSALREIWETWKKTLFPNVGVERFADAYAQTLTYALLLARVEGAKDLDPRVASRVLGARHSLLGAVLDVLTVGQARDEVGPGLDLLRRILEAIDPHSLAQEDRDLWFYFYEDFLAAYDPELRKSYGIYYTPPRVVKAMVRFVDWVLQERMKRRLGLADPDVLVLDPAAGTGAFLQEVLEKALEDVEEAYGRGERQPAASEIGKRIYGFEVLVGPYAVAHLRLSQALAAEGAPLPAEGLHIYLTDTLEAPYASPPGSLGLLEKPLVKEHEQAQKVKLKTPILVCIGNPPYKRHHKQERMGGWVRFGDDEENPEKAIFQNFLRPAVEAGYGRYVTNLYNAYVYFWRWALWKVFESEGATGPGIVALITASSYLRGPGFAGMRCHMRRTFDEIWVLDLGGEGRGAIKEENIFAIRTPVAIAIGVRYGESNPETPAKVHYTRVRGNREEKLAALEAAENLLASFAWQDVPSDWLAPFSPGLTTTYADWPSLSNIFPWQLPGAKYERTWPIAPTREVLKQRWQALVAEKDIERRKLLFHENRDRKVLGKYPNLFSKKKKDSPIAELPADTPPPPIWRYSLRSFDRQWAFADNRLGSFLRPPLWQIWSARQIYLTTLLKGRLGPGLAATVTAHVPDLHHFSGRGGKDIIPLWRDRKGKKPNITRGLLEVLSETYGQHVTAETLLAYTYALLAHPGYYETFQEELEMSGPRLPLTKDSRLFFKAAALGQRLIWLHTYGERMGGGEEWPIQGRARAIKPIPPDPNNYPTSFSYNAETQTLQVGLGEFAPISQDVWEFEVSGLQVVRSWLAYRMKEPKGKRSSPLDDITQSAWTHEMTRELLELLWTLDASVDMWPAQAEVLETVIQNELFKASELPQPTKEERKPPPKIELESDEKRNGKLV